jgi:hypothetical protein
MFHLRALALAVPRRLTLRHILAVDGSAVIDSY